MKLNFSSDGEILLKLGNLTVRFKGCQSDYSQYPFGYTSLFLADASGPDPDDIPF